MAAWGWAVPGPLAAGIAAAARSRACFLGCLCLCLAADFSLARVLLPNSDSVQSYNEMLAVRAGNLLLRQWVLATDNYLLTDLPPFTLASLVLGTGPRLIYLVPFLVFVLMLAGCLLLVRAAGRSRIERLAGGYAVLLLLGVPYGLYYNFFFWSDFHVATVTLCLYAVLAAEPALSGRRFNRLRLLAFMALIFAAAFSDPMADGLLVGPLWLFAGLRAWLRARFRSDDWLLAGIALLGVGASLLALHALARAGGFATLPDVTLAFVPGIAGLLHDLHALLGGGQMLFTARAVLIKALPLHHVIAALRQLTAVAVAALCGCVLWRMPRAAGAGAAQLLVIAAACFAAIAVMSTTFSNAVSTGPGFPGAAVRFVLPVFVFLCLAAALQAQELFIACSLAARQWIIGIGLCFAAVQAVGGIAAAVAAGAAPPGIQAAPQRVLADWLLRNGLRYGVGDYWDTQMVHALSSGAVTTDPVTQAGGRLLLYPWLTDTSRFGYNIPPQFVVIRPYGLFHIDLAGVTATYGKPVSVTEVAGFYFVARLKPPPAGSSGRRR